ncbi:COG1361 S-layer family protein [Cellulosilyticum ruminicola]|uniref:COG1361 S-layer family protein n=1 Tax=Cellulosilyticum ruminicola TaxID=425254 RepID=UPI0006D20A94|nr:hypothetical protein [Cellulosilyticum ruminicola]
MKHKYNWFTWLLSLVMIASYMLPGNFSLVYGAETSIQIKSISQNSNNIQLGESFTLKVDVLVNNTDNEKEMYILKPSVSGSGIDAANLDYSVSDEEGIKGGGVLRTVTISGLVYEGDDKKITVDIPIGTKTDQEKKNPHATGSYVTSGSKDYKLSAKTSEDYKEGFSIDNQENLIVELGKTQKVTVKVTNKTASTISKAKATLALGSSVKGLKIKESETTISNIKAKETRKLTFTIDVDEDTKGGVYPATLSILGSSYEVKIQVDTNIVPSSLEISSKGNTIFTPGVAKKAGFTLTNVGDRDAKNVRVEVVNSENVSIVNGGNVKHIGTLAKKSSKDIELSLKVASSVKSSTVPVQLKLTYLSSTGEEKEDSQYIYLDTSVTAASSEVIISNVVSPTKTFGVDQNFNVKFNVSSKSGAEKLKITVTGDEGIVPKSQNLFFLNKLGRGETKQYTVTFAATAAAVSSAHAIKIEIEYGEGETPVVVNQYGSVNITNPKKDKEDNKSEEGDDKDKKGKPKVIVGEYSVNPVVVKAGENFELEIGFLNTSKKEAVHNLKANLKIVEQGENNTGTVFAPVKASNTFYIADLNPGETQTKKITMYTIPSAAPKTYEVSLEMAYEDKDGTEVTATENIGIPVEQATKIEIGDINVDLGQVGMEAALSASIYNTGKTNVTNVIVHIEGEGFSVQDNKVFIGALESQAQETYAPTLIPEQEGILTGKLIIDYEDTTGEAKQIIEEFNFEVEAAMPIADEMPSDDEMPMEEVSHGPKWQYIVGIGGGVIVLIVVGIVVMKKRKKKKEEMMLDED